MFAKEHENLRYQALRGIMKIHKIAQTFPSTLTASELEDKIDEWNLRDSGGIIDYDTAQEIANYSNVWELKTLTLKELGAEFVADPKYRNKSKAYPIIVFFDGTGYEILDGKHRLAMANARGDGTILAYVGKIENENKNIGEIK